MTDFKQLDIYWVELEPTQNAEARKLRSCVILQGDLVNLQSRTLLMAPLLPQHRPWPFAVNLEPTQNNGLDQARHINLKQLRAIDISRMGKKQGRLESHYLKLIREALRIVLDW